MPEPSHDDAAASQAHDAVPFVIVDTVGLVVLLASSTLGDMLDALDLFDGAITGAGLGDGTAVSGAVGACQCDEAVRLRP